MIIQTRSEGMDLISVSHAAKRAIELLGEISDEPGFEPLGPIAGGLALALEGATETLIKVEEQVKELRALSRSRHSEGRLAEAAVWESAARRLETILNEPKEI